MIRVLIADDHTIVRQGLRQVLEETNDISVVAEANDGREVMSAVRSQEVDVAVIDISMPGRSGLEVLQDLKSVRPKISVLVLTMHPEEHYAVRALRAGAAGYLTKSSAADELIEAIRKVSRGGRYVTASVAERLALEFQLAGDKPLHEFLSDREHQVMCMIARGMSVTEIGDELALSSKTVSTYRTRILTKLGLKNNAEIVRFALKEGLIS
jgi:DNA-binding NarL/FixJ family response regulator